MDKIFYEINSSDTIVKRISFNGIKLLSTLHGFIGDANLGIIKDQVFQSQVLKYKNSGHEVMMEKFNVLMCEIVGSLINLDIYSGQCVLNVSVLTCIMQRLDLNYVKGLRYLSELKALFPGVKLSHRGVWRVFR